MPATIATRNVLYRADTVFIYPNDPDNVSDVLDLSILVLLTELNRAISFPVSAPVKVMPSPVTGVPAATRKEVACCSHTHDAAEEINPSAWFAHSMIDPAPVPFAGRRLDIRK